MKRVAWVLVVLALAALIGAAVWFWRGRAEPPVAVSTAPPAATVATGQVTQPAASEPAAVQHPVEAPAAEPALTATDLPAALDELLGHKAVLSWLLTDDFARRVVATVDNLGRSFAPSAMWPVHTTAGRFQASERGGRLVVDADNALRYTPFVLFVEAIDVDRAAALYRRMYPLLQQAWQDIGYPKGYFNDRLFEVIDLLLATPEAGDTIALRLTEVQGPIPSTQPWLRYRFADPAFEKLSAGQKILLRMGAVNERRLKSRLAAFRLALAKLGPAR
ncbi:MAG: hypothetical protein ABT20_00670 [Rubrivivax sp. SCN 70-15]|nr:MAG: hypothetical protein ABT20_00670 [Rubrivivax sp. SCN 70-15]